MHAGNGEFEVHPSAYFVRNAAGAGDSMVSGEFINFYAAVLRKLWRRKLLVALVTLLGTGVGTAIVLRMPSYYAAHAFVVIGDQSAKTLPTYNSQQGGVRSTLPDSTAVQTEVEIIKSPQLVTEVVRDLTLQEKPEFNPAATSWFEEWFPGSRVKDWLFGAPTGPDPQEDAVELSQTI